MPSQGPNRITVDFFANTSSKFIQLSYMGPDTAGEWAVMPVAVLQHESRQQAVEQFGHLHFF